MELHISGERKYLALASIRAAPQRVISGDESAKLAGCAGAELGPLLPQLAEDATLTGVLVASDGLVSAPITAGELCRGVLLHTDAGGTMLSSLRAWFPPGVAVQPSPCGTHVGPLSLKGACCCILLPKSVTDALAMSEARVVGHMNGARAARARRTHRGIATWAFEQARLLRLSLPGLVSLPGLATDDCAA